MTMLWTILLILLVSCATGDIVKVAVYEHAVTSPENATSQFTREEAFEWMLINLKMIRQQAQIAADKGAKIIVFPEYGVTGFDHSRNSIVPFLEDIPDVSMDWVPCDDPKRFENTKVLEYLSCSAKLAKIYIVANIGDIKTCKKETDSGCPNDGRFQYNTNIVFSSDGKLVAKYHKRNLYDESPLFDTASTIEYSYFETPFGKFGTVICFDLLHYYPTQELLLKYDIKNLLVTSAWNVFNPFVFPIQMYAGLSKTNNINVIAANVRHSNYQMASSGIFGPGTEVSSDTDFSNDVGQLLIGEIDTVVKPADFPDTLESMTSVDTIKTNTNQTYSGTNHYFGMKMYFVVLSDSGFASVCDKTGVCCALEYEFSKKDSSEVVILSVANFNLEAPGRIHMQYCAVHFCPSSALQRCGEPVYKIKSVFSKLKLQGFFDATRHLIFPFVSSMPYQNQTYFSERSSYRFDKVNAILQADSFTHPLFTAVVFNSVQDKQVVVISPVSRATSFIFLSTISSFISVVHLWVLCIFRLLV